MRKIISSIFILTFLTVIGFCLMRFEKSREPKGLIPKFSWQGKKEMNEWLLGWKRMGLLPFWPRCLVVRKNYLYATDPLNRIQVLKINPDGSLTPKSSFGKEGKGLGEFGRLSGLIIAGKTMYILDL